MLSVLAKRTYRHLFLAQVIALLGTGFATIALGLLAFELAGEAAGTVLGTALAIKMMAYVGIAPLAAAALERLPRRAVLVSLDLVRAGIVVLLPWVTEIWQIYLLIFLLQSASAAFTPTFQATIPDILPREEDYTRALSLSRIAYDLENLLSPLLAAVLLTLVSFHALFAGTALSFLVSAALVLSVVLVQSKPTERGGFGERVTRGLRIYLATPRLRGLLGIFVAVSAAGSMVIVNSVVWVQGIFGLSEQAVALALAAFGCGSMIAAMALPRLLEHLDDRRVMLAAAGLMIASLAGGIFLANYAALLALWFLLGLGYSAAQTPAGRLLRRSARSEDRPAVFAAQFALSHSCWLLSYPLAGWLGQAIGLPASFAVLALLAGAGLLAAWFMWPARDETHLAHRHDDLDDDHRHWQEGREQIGKRHVHAFYIDRLHRKWPQGSAPGA